MNRRPRLAAAAFTLVELLVVIGIIAVLLAILVPVVSNVRKQAYTTSTASRMTQISGAIQSYYMDNQAYPGAVPINLWTLPGGTQEVPATMFPGAGYNNLTGTEDLVMSLMGGWKVQTTTPFALVYDPAQLGSGALNLNPLRAGERKNAYLSYAADMLSPSSKTPTQLKNEPGYSYVTDSPIPEFIDAYPEYRPILYLRATVGAVQNNQTKIVTDAYNAADPSKVGVHYYLAPIAGYLRTTGTDKDTLTLANGDTKTRDYFMQTVTLPSPPGGQRVSAKHAGTYILIAAGPDRMFGTSDDIVVGGGGGQ
jgi:prepilin-type N-terminal cleavage/methylation domain-containing protein